MQCTWQLFTEDAFCEEAANLRYWASQACKMETSNPPLDEILSQLYRVTCVLCIFQSQYCFDTLKEFKSFSQINTMLGHCDCCRLQIRCCCCWLLYSVWAPSKYLPDKLMLQIVSSHHGIPVISRDGRSHLRELPREENIASRSQHVYVTTWQQRESFVPLVVVYFWWQICERFQTWSSNWLGKKMFIGPCGNVAQTRPVEKKKKKQLRF